MTGVQTCALPILGLALPACGGHQLELEAQRLVALLESARAHSRASGQAAYWRANAGGFEFVGLPAARFPATPWLDPATEVREATLVTLGPEPIIEAQHIVLSIGERTLRIATNGLRPFAPQAADAQNADGNSP